jgi:hypothetical protein
MTRIRVRPARPNLLIPDPDAPATDRWLPPEGRAVPDTEYWRRRLADGDVVPSSPPRAARPRRAEKE